MVIVNVIKSNRDVVAICDSDLIGKKFEEEKFQLDVKESFFRGKEMSEEEAIKIVYKMMEEDATFYIIGKESIDLTVKAGAIDEREVKTIQGIPFSLVLM